MQTSKTIKTNQRKPPTIIDSLVASNGNPYWVVKGQLKAAYRVRRTSSNAFICSCPATGLCRHIEAVVKDLVLAKGFPFVQFWTSEEDADKQHRAKYQMTANGKSFWITLPKPKDPVAELDAEIERIGQELVEQRRRWYAVGAGQQKADAALERELLSTELGRLVRERERAVAARGK